ncbi:MAG: ComEC family competence protein, partial [Gammaproteobacteria bacterium]|nr:ComEC family competence protein [Gammaproteobacteria bacterium]
MRAVFILGGLVLAVLLPMHFAAVLLILVCLIPLVVIRTWHGLAGFVGVGVLISLIWQAHSLSRWPPVEASEPIWVTGVVVDLPENRPHQQRFLLQPESIEALDWRLPRRIRVSVYDEHFTVSAGERWRLPLKLRRPRGFMNPVRFDYEHWLAAGKVDATAVLASPTEAMRINGPKGLSAWRERVSARIAQHVSTPSGTALLQGLVTGDRRGFTDRMWEVLRTTGTGHLLAISGLHIGLIAAFGYATGRMVWRFASLPGNRIVWSLFFGAGLATGYAALAGFSVPTTRALVMLCVGAIVVIFRRRLRGMWLLTFAALGLVILDPATALRPGAWLSFTAVGLILMLVRGRQLGFVKGLWVLQLGLFIGLAPLTASFFGSFSPLSIPINLLVLPLFSLLVVPGALLSTGLLWVYEPAGAFGLAVLGFVLEHLAQAGGWLVDYGAVPVYVAQQSIVGILLSGVAVGLFFLPAGSPMRGLAYIFLMLLVLTPRSVLAPGDA